MVRPITTVNVQPKMPKQLARLHDLAYNMRFAWDHETISLFRRLDPDLWEQTNHNPVWLLGLISQERLEAAKNDPAFMASLERTAQAFDDYMAGKNTWYEREYGHLEKHPVIAYFSMEFGITEAFQNYSGGLGVLSGDHLKSASDLNIPLVGVGLLYQEGYFQQYLNSDGWQQERYPINDFSHLPVTLVTGKDGNPLKVDVPLPGRKLFAQVWKAEVGRVSLYLLDSNIADNPLEEDRSLTDRLYGGDRRTRIRQEILLGIGGMRVLEALGLRPDVTHMNEGHSAFFQLERARILMHENGLTFNQARELVAASNVYTVHTPVPAGLERFGFDLIDEHFSDYIRDLGLSREAFHALGRERVEDGSEVFSLPVMALAFSYGTNGVAQLHGEVSRRMWQWLYPDLPEDEVPIGAVTNGIHVQTWTSRDMGSLLDRYLDPAWRTEDSRADVWEAIENVPDSELWRTHARRRERLVAFCRHRLKKQLIERGAPQTEIDEADEVLNPDALTIGFARRFATYKRATLIFNDLDRLDALVNNPERPVQFIFAGKAHPHDTGGKELIQRIVEVARMPRFRHSIVFLENYDMNIGRYLVQGVDVWLNNPRRPKEASGTSGMKVVYNGGLNFSVLDGWWAEAYTPEVGWAIGNGEEYPPEMTEEQDRIEGHSILHVLANDIVARFYDRGRDGLPREWLQMVKTAIRELAPFFTTTRMVQQYTAEYYMPNWERIQKMLSPDLETAKAYADWREHLGHIWHEIVIEHVDMSANSIKVGNKTDVEARIRLGSLTPDNVRVQLYVGKLDTRGHIIHGESVDMEVDEMVSEGVYTFKTSYKYIHTGEVGVSVRVVPYHEFMSTSFQPKLITWA